MDRRAIMEKYCKNCSLDNGELTTRQLTDCLDCYTALQSNMERIDIVLKYRRGVKE